MSHAKDTHTNYEYKKVSLSNLLSNTYIFLYERAEIIEISHKPWKGSGTPRTYPHIYLLWDERESNSHRLIKSQIFFH